MFGINTTHPYNNRPFNAIKTIHRMIFYINKHHPFLLSDAIAAAHHHLSYYFYIDN